MAFLDDSGLAYFWQKIQEAIQSIEHPYTYGTTDMVDGVTPLETGHIYFVYEDSEE